MKSFQQILLKFGTRPPGHILRTLSRWRFAQIDDFVDQKRNFRSRSGKDGNFLTLTANISKWVARSASRQETCFVQHFVGRLLRYLWCFCEKNWAKYDQFSGANQEIIFLSLPISPIFFSFWTSQGVTPGQIQSRQIHLAWNPGSFFAWKLKEFLVFTEIDRLYPHRNFHFCVFLLSNFQIFLTKRCTDVQKY